MARTKRIFSVSYTNRGASALGRSAPRGGDFYFDTPLNPKEREALALKLNELKRDGVINPIVNPWGLAYELMRPEDALHRGLQPRRELVMGAISQVFWTHPSLRRRHPCGIVITEHRGSRLATSAS